MTKLNGSQARNRVALAHALGGAIGRALEDERVVEVMANPDGSIWVDAHGRGRYMLEDTIAREEANTVIRIVADYAGGLVNADSPLVSATLPGTGERFQGLFPPVVEQASFAIRKRAKVVFTLDQYVDRGIMTEQTAVTLRRALTNRLNILVIGGTGSGKTTLTNALLAEPAIIDDRVLLIEDTAELQCVARDCVSMRTKVSEPVITMADLARATLRLRPDRIIVGEVRDGSILDMIKLWNTGHPGGIATLHANSPEDALYRVEDLIGEVTERIPVRQIYSTINMIVQIKRCTENPSGRIVETPRRVLGHLQGQYLFSEGKDHKGVIGNAV
jgi:type IV secretion system protein VirB11